MLDVAKKKKENIYLFIYSYGDYSRDRCTMLKCSQCCNYYRKRLVALVTKFKSTDVKGIQGTSTLVF